MAREVEAKFKVTDLSRVRRALRSAGARHLGTVFQTDRYFDTPRGRLRKADVGLRVRTVRRLTGVAPGTDTRPEITYKGPARPRARAKIRREIQTHIEHPDAVGEILRALGLAAAATIRKRRASYRLGRCRIELDELPVIGRFVEIEAPSEKQVLAMARRLGLVGKPIRQHYVALLLSARRSSRRTSSRRTRRPKAHPRQR